MIRYALPLLLLSAAVSAPAQSLSEYLRMRGLNKVHQPSAPAALQNVSAAKVLEIKGVVKGSFRVEDRTSLLVELADGSTHEIDANAVPDWMTNGEVPARLLVKVIPGGGANRTVLIGASRESEMHAIEAKEAAKKKAAADAKKAAAAKQTNQGNRNGRSPLSGPIGRGGSTMSRGGAVNRQWYLPASDVTPFYASYIKQVNRRLDTQEAMTMAKAIVGFCLRYGVDPRLIMAMIFVESGFDPNAVSRSGAMGLGQLMPGTARWMGVDNPFDSIENLYGMVRLVRTHLDTYHRKARADDNPLALALAAYNAGEGAVRRHGGVPPYKETQAYVRKVIALYYRMAGA